MAAVRPLDDGLSRRVDPDLRQPGLRRQVAGGLAMRIARYPLQLAFVVLVPPLLGAEAYGAYATCIALWALVISATDIGVGPVLGRFLPGMRDPEASRLVRQVLWIRLGLVAGPGTLLLGTLWTSWPGDPLVFLLVLLAILVDPIQSVLFGLLYARGQIAWVMARDPARSALSLALVVPGYLLAGLVGAVGAMAASQVAVTALAARWSRPTARQVRPPETFSGVRPALRFGVAAALPMALTVIALKVGVVVLPQVGRSTIEVANFDLAVHGLSLVTFLVGYLFHAFMPTLGQAYDAGRTDEVYRWWRPVAARTAAASALVVIGIVAVGERLPVVLLGPDFSELYRNLVLLVGIGIFAALVNQAGLSVVMVARAPERAILPAVLLVLVTAAANVVAAPRLGAWGSGVALVGGLTVQAGCLLVLTPRLPALVLPSVGLGLAAVAPVLSLAYLELAGAVTLAGGARGVALMTATALAALPLWMLQRQTRGAGAAQHA